MKFARNVTEVRPYLLFLTKQLSILAMHIDSGKPTSVVYTKGHSPIIIIGDVEAGGTLCLEIGVKSLVSPQSSTDEFSVIVGVQHNSEPFAEFMPSTVVLTPNWVAYTSNSIARDITSADAG